MKAPTIEDVQRMVPEARDEHEADPPLDASPGPMAADAVDVLKTLLSLVAMTSVRWHEVRALALRAMYICALVAWEAGRRMVDAAGRDASGLYVHGGPKMDPDLARHLNTGAKLESPAKSDVDALLRETDEWTAARAISGASRPAKALLTDLAATLRARAPRATRHLRAVLDFMWPVGGWMTSPTVVQRARAFLAGDGQAPLHDDAREIELLRKELADKGAALGRMVERYEKEKAHVDGLVEAVRSAKAEVLAEDEAHAHTKARLAEVERERDEWKKVARANAQDMHKALAAQNRAESERDAVRAELAALVAGVERLMAQMPKGKA
jgi:hypothetical protein